MRFWRFLGTLALLSCGATEGHAQAAPRPFPCDGQLYQIATANSTLKALNFVETSSGYTTNFNNIASAGANLNAGWGYNDLDSLIYGVRLNTRDLYRIDFDGNFEYITTLDNTFERGSFVGDVLPNGIMIYRARDNALEWQLVDITDPANPVNNGIITLTQAASGADFAYNPIDGMMYGIHSSNDRLFYVDINSLLNGGGTATPVFFGPAVHSGGYGAMWFDEDGRLYTYDNNSNEISVMNVGVMGNGTGNATLLAVSTEDEGGTNDGAYCRGPAPVPLGNVTGTVYEDIDSDDMMGGSEPRVGAGVGISIYYDNGTQADLSDDVFLGSTETQADGTYTFTGLATIETYRVEIDITDPDLPAHAGLGTSNPLIGVTVNANSATSGLDFGFDPGSADLEITKTANVTTALPGDTVTWTISITNQGNGSPANVMVSDLIPSGFTYVSDDAPAVGDYYDPSNGNWFVDEILVGATETLNIVTTANAGGDRTNYAEITFSSMPDPDSDFTVGRLIVDGTDDDEAAFTVAETPGQTVAGRLFLDNGAGGATAHDATIGGAESAGIYASVTVTDGTGTVLATPTVNADGTWIAALPFGYANAVTVTATPVLPYLSVSEADPGLPGLTNTSPIDGTYTFTPTSGSSYTGLDFGLIDEPVMTSDRVSAIASGQTVDLSHRYEATSTSTVTFSLVDEVSTPGGAFSSTIFTDTDCDGAADSPLMTGVAVQAGDTVCIVVRTQAGTNTNDGANQVYGIRAHTAFTGIPRTSEARNDDRLDAGQGNRLVLLKRVRNVTLGTPEGTQNIGEKGQVLEYRLILTNPGTVPANDVVVSDTTPSWTSLTLPVATSTAVAPGVTCTLSNPSGGANATGYIGPLKWSCPGAFMPGNEGSLTFQVTIAP